MERTTRDNVALFVFVFHIGHERFSSSLIWADVLDEE